MCDLVIQKLARLQTAAAPPASQQTMAKAASRSLNRSDFVLYCAFFPDRVHRAVVRHYSCNFHDIYKNNENPTTSPGVQYNLLSVRFIG